MTSRNATRARSRFSDGQITTHYRNGYPRPQPRRGERLDVYVVEQAAATVIHTAEVCDDLGAAQETWTRSFSIGRRTPLRCIYFPALP